MARLGSGHFHRNVVTSLPEDGDAPVIVKQRSVPANANYPVARMVSLLGAMAANLAALSRAGSRGEEGAAAKPKPKAPARRLAAPATLGETLQRLLLPPDMLASDGLAADQKLTPEQCRHILTACAKVLPTPMEFDPSNYNKAQVNQLDAVDHDPTVPQTYLRNIAAALTLVVGSLPPSEAHIIRLILQSLANKIQELDPRTLGPTVVASKPGDKMNHALGATFPPNPMTPPAYE